MSYEELQFLMIDVTISNNNSIRNSTSALAAFAIINLENPKNNFKMETLLKVNRFPL